MSAPTYLLSWLVSAALLIGMILGIWAAVRWAGRGWDDGEYIEEPKLHDQPR